MPYIVIDHYKVEMSEEEIIYYNELSEIHGKDCFSKLFKTDQDGIILIIKPTKTVPLAVLFFMQNLMINQHLRIFDTRIAEVEHKVKL